MTFPSVLCTNVMKQIVGEMKNAVSGVQYGDLLGTTERLTVVNAARVPLRQTEVIGELRYGVSHRAAMGW